jgi:hypothetical protein
MKYQKLAILKSESWQVTKGDPETPWYGVYGSYAYMYSSVKTRDKRRLDGAVRSVPHKKT